MRCLICDANDWENVDQYRAFEKKDDKQVGMSICKSCGFVTYPEKYKTKAEIKEYYRESYRSGPPRFENFATGERKLRYHEHFLHEVFKKWEENKTEPVVGEVGAAIGLPLNMIKTIFPKAEVHGTEWDVKSRMVAFHEFGLRLGEELPKDRKYDFLMTYKVAEHQMDVDQELAEYHEMLKDDGYLYISVPTWFKVLENFGLGGFDLDYYYHVDHINVWTQKLFESLLKKTGFQIIKFDDYIYGETYLCKKTKPQPLTKKDFENPEDIKKMMGKIKEAAEAFNARRFDDAIKAWPKFPSAWAARYELTRDKLHKKHNGDVKAILKEVVEPMKESLGLHPDVDRMEADLLMRYGHFVEAIEVLDNSLNRRPNHAQTMMQMAHAFRKMAETTMDPDKRMEYWLTARQIGKKVAMIDKQAYRDAINWTLVDATNIPIDDFIDYVQRKKKELQNGKSIRHESTAGATEGARA